ncbi:glycosyltransferase [Frigidibacter sp. MR17.14]|uniref:glycosyltransferase family 2 protein n=1 Tax=Frigidibacter sp. MR17.14 TaxID=3126509 RepID=UPI003012D722
MRPAAPWDIFHVDLSAPVALELQPEAQAAILFFRQDGMVVGRSALTRAAFPMSAEQVRALGAGAGSWIMLSQVAGGGYDAALQGHVLPPARASQAGAFDVTGFGQAIAARRHRSSRSVTLVICTLNRPQQLAACLETVRAAFDPGPGREILVVDNGPDAATRAVVEAAGATYVAEPRRGLSNARNAALREIESEIVAFIDDDVLPEPGWIEPLLNAFDDPQVGVATGLVLPLELRSEAQISFEMDLGFGGMGLQPLRFDPAFLEATGPWGVPSWNIGAGANMAIRRDLVDRIGLFDPRLGHGGQASGAGEDSEFWRRALEAGVCCFYEPASVVRHEHRADWNALRRQVRGYAMGHLAAIFAQYGNHRRRGDLWRAFYILPGHYTKRLLLSWRRRMLRIPDLHLHDEIRGYLQGVRYIGFTRPPSARRRFRQCPRPPTRQSDL